MIKALHNYSSINIYRVVKANSRRDVNIEKPGNHWIYDEGNLDTCAQWCVDCAGDKFFEIEARAKAEDINWKRTIWTNFNDGAFIGEINTIPEFKSSRRPYVSEVDFSDVL